MSEASELRRRKILENAQRRLERLQNLKREREIESDVKDDDHKNDTSEDHTEDDCDAHTNVVGGNKTESKASVETNKTENKLSGEDHLDDDAPPTMTDMPNDKASNAVMERIYKKNHAFMCVILAVVAYFISQKGYLISVLGKTWQRPETFFKLFCMVESQMIVVAFLKKDGTVVPAYLNFLCTLLRVPNNLKLVVSKLAFIFNMIIVDFCVFIFVIVLLCYYKV